MLLPVAKLGMNSSFLCLQVVCVFVFMNTNFIFSFGYNLEV